MDARSIPSDATLVWLASERAAPLFRTLDRAGAFSPLVVLMAVLPSVLATFAETMTSVDAAWGLRALEATGSNLPPQAAAVAEAIVPVERIRPAALWLSAMLMRLADPARPVSSSLASLLGGAAMLGVLWPLAKELSGRRFAFWAVLLAAFHPTLTRLLLFPAPVTVSLALAVAALWGHLSLGERPLHAGLAGAVAVGSIAAGVWLVGWVALLVPAVISFDALFALFLAWRNPSDPATSRRKAGPSETALRRLAAAAFGVAIGAGVAVVVPLEIGGLSQLDAGASPLGAVEPMLDTNGPVVVGPLWGLAAIGLGRLLRIVHRRASVRGSRSVPRLILAWLLLAGGTALWSTGSGRTPFDPVERYVIGLASLPLLLSAAYAIEEAARRLVSGAWVLLAVALPMAVRLGSLMATISADSPLLWIILGGAVAGAAWFAARAMPAAVSLPGLRRGMLMGAILLVIAVNAADGLGVLFSAVSGDDAYIRLTTQLAAEASPKAIVLLTQESPPAELLFALRASHPDAAMEMAGTWDEATLRVERMLGPGNHSMILAAWGLRDTVGAAPSADELHPTGDPLLFAGRELLLYVANDDSERATDLEGPAGKSP